MVEPSTCRQRAEDVLLIVSDGSRRRAHRGRRRRTTWSRVCEEADHFVAVSACCGIRSRRTAPTIRSAEPGTFTPSMIIDAPQQVRRSVGHCPSSPRMRLLPEHQWFKNGIRRVEAEPPDIETRGRFHERLAGCVPRSLQAGFRSRRSSLPRGSALKVLRGRDCGLARRRSCRR